MGKKGTEIAIDNDLIGLGWINRFGWIRPQEIGYFLWPAAQHRVKNAERIARRWIESGLCIARDLPMGSGRALVLSSRGAEFLCDRGTEARTGKDIGEVVRGEWRPPASWRHDLRAAGVLARLSAKGCEVWPERQLRAAHPGVKKIPDGIAVDSQGVGYWLEVERAHKSGRELDHLIDSIGSVSAGRAARLSGVQCTVPLVAVSPREIDSRGYAIDHQHRVTQAIRARVGHDVTVVFLVLKLAGEGVSDYEKNIVRVEADSISRRVKMLRSGWEARGDTRTCLAPGRELVIEKKREAWHWYAYDTTDDRPDYLRTTRREPVLLGQGVAATSEEAQRACAACWPLEEKPDKP